MVFCFPSSLQIPVSHGLRPAQNPLTSLWQGGCCLTQPQRLPSHPSTLLLCGLVAADASRHFSNAIPTLVRTRRLMGARVALNEIFVKNINYSGTGHGDKLGDGGRIHLLVTTTRKYWQLAYRYLGKQKMLALGGIPPCHSSRPGMSGPQQRKGSPGVSTPVQPSVRRSKQSASPPQATL